ncbi:MAG TPA: helix-turn-helix domain-containing protein [Pyrinomonadaceae bacterium]
MSALEQSMREIMKSAVEEANAPLLQKIDGLERQIKSLLSQMTIKQAAEYLKVTEQSIRNWSERNEDENPFPIHHAGGDPRFIRAEIDQWSKVEAERRLNKRREQK